MPSKSKSLKKRILKTLGLYNSPPASPQPRDVIHVSRKQLENFNKSAAEAREYPMFAVRDLPKKTSPSERVKLTMQRYNNISNVASRTKTSSKKGGKKRKTVKKKSSWW